MPNPEVLYESVAAILSKVLHQVLRLVPPLPVALTKCYEYWVHPVLISGTDDTK